MTNRPIIVVGAGVAGCVVAGTLARESSAPIVVVEAGESAESLFDPTSRTLSFVESLARPSTRRDDLLVRRTSVQEPKPYPAGRGIGGSGEINALVASWGMQHDVVSWGDTSPFGVDAWRSALATLPHVLRTVGEGEWGPMDRALVSACTASGVPRNDALWNDLTSPEGVGTATIFARGESRSTGVDALLRSAIAAGRVRVDRGASVERVVVRDDVVRGVELANGDVLDARAVILCAGAFGSVEVLQRSALLPKVVRGVQDHPAIALVTREPITQSSRLSIGSIGRLSSRGGIGNIHLVSMNATAPGERSHGALLVALMDVESRGSVTYGDDGGVGRDLNMLSTGDEMAALSAALRRIVPIVGQMEERLGTEFHLADRTESVGWIIDSSDAEVSEWVAASCGVYAHAASSLPIGGEHLDRRGALRSVDGAWVADTSVMPRLVAGNPTLAIAAIARAIAQNVAAATAAS